MKPRITLWGKKDCPTCVKYGKKYEDSGFHVTHGDYEAFSKDKKVPREKKVEVLHAYAYQCFFPVVELNDKVLTIGEFERENF